MVQIRQVGPRIGVEVSGVDLRTVDDAGFAAIAYLAGIGASRMLGAKLASFVGLTEVLCARCRGSLALDLADLHFVDVAGMRGLRGRPGERSIAIVAASEAVRRLSDLMGWDTDPGVAW